MRCWIGFDENFLYLAFSILIPLQVFFHSNFAYPSPMLPWRLFSQMSCVKTKLQNQLAMPMTDLSQLEKAQRMKHRLKIISTQYRKFSVFRMSKFNQEPLDSFGQKPRHELICIEFLKKNDNPHKISQYALKIFSEMMQ